jgi:hypothetical protein
LPARWYKETLEPVGPGARVVAQFADGVPAAVISTFGRGRTLMLGSYVSAAAQSTPTPESERFYAGLLQWAGVTLPIRVTGAPLEVRHLEAGPETLLFLFNHGKASSQGDVWLARMPGQYTATDMTDGRALVVASAPDGISIRVDLKPADVHVLRITRR